MRAQRRDIGAQRVDAGHRSIGLQVRDVGRLQGSLDAARARLEFELDALAAERAPQVLAPLRIELRTEHLGDRAADRFGGVDAHPLPEGLIAKAQTLFAVDVGNEHRQVVGDCAQSLLAGGQSGLHVLALGDVVQERDRGEHLAGAQRADRQLDRNLVPGAVQRHHLDAAVDDRPGPAVDEAVQPRGVGVAHARRNDDLGHRPAEDLGAFPAEGRLRLIIPVGDATVVVHRDEGVGRVRQDAEGALFAEPQLLGPRSGVLGLSRRSKQHHEREAAEEQCHAAEDQRLAAPVGEPVVDALADADHQARSAHALETAHSLDAVG